MTPPAAAEWRPTASFAALRQRASILARIRAFFAARGVLEVETPLLCAATVSDVHLASLTTEVELFGTARRFFLQTSPEYAMKRLLAAGSGPIYQLCKAFRDGECGRQHNPEFTLLEWYELGAEPYLLLDTMDALLGDVLGTPAAQRVTYGELFGLRLGVDPHRTSSGALREIAKREARTVPEGIGDDLDALLQVLFAECIEPTLGRQRPTYVLDWPASQAALARIRPSHPPVAERFEVYIGGVEIANGFHELADAAEQRQRFAADLERRRDAGVPPVPLDERLLAALASGLPDCSGVALGVDRLVMLATGATSLAEVVALPIERA